MAVRTVSVFQVFDGRRDQFLRESEQAKAIATRIGARFRLGEMVVAGAQTGQFVVTQEFDDLVGYAAFMQKRGVDKEWQDFQKTVHGNGASSTVVSRSLVQDVM
jgi:hypothetical protein